MKIENLPRLMAKLTSRLVKARREDGVSVIVGFGTAYAVYVHENLEAHHPVGMAKFLEKPARQFAGVIGDIVRRAMQRGASFGQALLMGGLRLQREAQLLTPVLTGALRASAFTRLDNK